MIRSLILGVLLSLVATAAWAQVSGEPSYLYCNSGGSTWKPCTSTNPLAVTGSGGGGGITVFTPLGYQQYTSLSVATPLTGVPAGATMALICVETSSVRWRDDGTNPTALIGQPIGPGQCFTYSSSFTAIKFIAQLGAPVLDVSYYK